jgi:hypothetical protein
MKENGGSSEGRNMEGAFGWSIGMWFTREMSKARCDHCCIAPGEAGPAASTSLGVRSNNDKHPSEQSFIRRQDNLVA